MRGWEASTSFGGGPGLAIMMLTAVAADDFAAREEVRGKNEARHREELYAFALGRKRTMSPSWQVEDSSKSHSSSSEPS